MASLRANIIRRVTSAYIHSMDMATVNVESRRKLWHRATSFLPTARGVVVEKAIVAELASEWLKPEGCRDDRVLLYLHGGGYVVGGCDMHRQLVSHVARACGLKALLPEYRLAPEHKYPAAIEDAVRVYEWLLDGGIAAKNIVLAGDSAGGGLCMALMLALKDRDIEQPRAAVLMSPFLDVTGSGESMQTRAKQDPWFKAENVSVIANYYCDKSQQQDPLVSPVFADVSGLPPLLVQVGDHEILLSDSERLRDNVVAAGGDIEYDVWPEMWHVFQMFVGKMPESQQAIDQIGEYVRALYER